MPRALRKSRISAAGHVQHRPDDAVGPLALDARESRETRPPLPREQVSLEPVIPLVRGRDPLRARLRGHLLERRVARVPGARLRGKPESPGLLPGVPPPEEEGEPEPPRVLAHEREVAVRLAPAPAVVDVPHGEPPPGLAGCFAPRHGAEPWSPRLPRRPADASPPAASARSRRPPSERPGSRPYVMVRRSSHDVPAPLLRVILSEAKDLLPSSP